MKGLKLTQRVWTIGLSLISLIIVLAIMALGTSITVHANQAAVVIKNGADGISCAFFDGNGNSVITTAEQVVRTQSANGDALLICKAKDIPNSTGQAVHWNLNNTGSSCALVSGGPPILFTDDWQETVSASGQAVLQCHFKD